MFRFSIILLRMMAGSRRWLAILVGAILLQLLYHLTLPILYKVIIDEGLTARDAKALTLAIAAVGALTIVFAAAALAHELAAATLGLKVANRLRQRLFEKLLTQSVEFYGRTTPAELAERFGGDLTAIEVAAIRSLPNILIYGLLTVLSVFALFAIEWRLAIVACLTLPAVMFASERVNRRTQAAEATYSMASVRSAGIAQEMSATHLAIRLFRLQQTRATAFLNSLRDLALAGTRSYLYSGLEGRVLYIAAGVGQVVVLVAGAILVFQGAMSVGLLIGFVGYLFGIGEAANLLAVAVPPLALGAAALRRVDIMLAEPDEIADTPGAIPMPPLRQRIAFDRVSFGYGPGSSTIDDITLTIDAGKTVAFVGPSGCGKSTILALILRLRRPDRGIIAFDGRSVADFDEGSLRAHLTLVPQVPILFSTDIRENLLVACPDAPDADLLAAAAAAGLTDIAVTIAGARDRSPLKSGRSLSGGERQRVSLAQAFLRNTDILLLDEATSALDPASECAVNDSLRRFARGRTVIAVTHRLGAVVDFDTIFVLDCGRLVESGKHQELLARRGLYHKLWGKQNGFTLTEAAGEMVASVAAERLREIPFLADCDLTLLERLSGLFESEFIEDGQTVVREGEPGNRFYVVVRGRLDVFRTRADGNEMRIGSLTDGDFFGEMALIEQAPRSASVRARSQTWCLSLTRRDFLALLGEAPNLDAHIRKTVRERLGQNLSGSEGEGI